MRYAKLPKSDVLSTTNVILSSQDGDGCWLSLGPISQLPKSNHQLPLIFTPIHRTVPPSKYTGLECEEWRKNQVPHHKTTSRQRANHHVMPLQSPISHLSSRRMCRLMTHFCLAFFLSFESHWLKRNTLCFLFTSFVNKQKGAQKSLEKFQDVWRSF